MMYRLLNGGRGVKLREQLILDFIVQLANWLDVIGFVGNQDCLKVGMRLKIVMGIDCKKLSATE